MAVPPLLEPPRLVLWILVPLYLVYPPRFAMVMSSFVRFLDVVLDVIVFILTCVIVIIQSFDPLRFLVGTFSGPAHKIFGGLRIHA